MLHSAPGREIRLSANSERRRRFERVMAAELPQVEPTARRTAAAATQVLASAMAWEYLRDYWSMDGAEASACAQRAIAALLRGLRAEHARPVGTNRGTKATRVARKRKDST